MRSLRKHGTVATSVVRSPSNASICERKGRSARVGFTVESQVKAETFNNCFQLLLTSNGYVCVFLVTAMHI